MHFHAGRLSIILFMLVSSLWVTNNPDPRMVLQYNVCLDVKTIFWGMFGTKNYLSMVEKIESNFHHAEEGNTRAEDDDQVVGSC